jgi:hypothetical protein
MGVLLITYNLDDPTRDYQKLFDRIRELGDTWHNAEVLESVWFVRTEAAPDQARDHIKAAMKRDDYCFIAEIAGRPRRGRMPQAFWDWLDKSS